MWEKKGISSNFSYFQTTVLLIVAATDFCGVKKWEDKAALEAASQEKHSKKAKRHLAVVDQVSRFECLKFIF